MKCPECSIQLEDHILVGKLYHKCPGCGGLWFDKGELSEIMQVKDWFKIDSKYMGASTKIDKSKQLCPRDEETLNTLEYGQETGIKIDVCPKCEGLWLDAGEVQAIHKDSETWTEKLKDIIEEELTTIELFLIKIGPYLPK